MKNYLIITGVNAGLLAWMGAVWLLLEIFGPVAIIPVFGLIVFVLPAIMFRKDIRRDWRQWRGRP